MSGSLYVDTMTCAPSDDRVVSERDGIDVARRSAGDRIAQCLRRHPVLTVAAVQVASEHAETECERARVGMEERLLLDRIALHAADISKRDAQPALLD